MAQTVDTPLCDLVAIVGSAGGGMPGAAILAGGVDEVLAVGEIGSAVIGFVGRME